MNKAYKFLYIALISTQIKCCLEELAATSAAFGIGVMYSKILSNPNHSYRDKAIITAIVMGRGAFNLQQDCSYITACGLGFLASEKICSIADRFSYLK